MRAGLQGDDFGVAGLLAGERGNRAPGQSDPSRLHGILVRDHDDFSTVVPSSEIGDGPDHAVHHLLERLGRERQVPRGGEVGLQLTGPKHDGNAIDAELERRDSWQGRLFASSQHHREE